MTRDLTATFLLVAILLGAGSAAADPDRARMALNSARELYSAGNWETASEVYEDARKAAPAGSILRAEATMELASLQWERGDYSVAHATARQALEQAQSLNLDQAAGRLMLTIGHIEASQGKLSQAENTLHICIKAAKEQHDAVFGALCQINLRFVRQLRGASVESEAAYRKRLELLKNSGEQVLVGTALAKSAELQEQRGDFAGALATLNQAQSQFIAAGSVPAQSRNRLRLAQSLQNLGRWPEAAQQLDGLVLDFRNMSNRPSLVTAYALRAKQRAHDGNVAGALEDFTEARKTARALGSPQIIANVELGLCEFYASANDMKSTQTHCNAASSAFSQVGIPALAARSHTLIGRLAHVNEEWMTAREQYLLALKLLDGVASSARDTREVAVQHSNLCQVETRLGANGAYRRCLDARAALGKVKPVDAALREMVAATAYSAGIAAPEEQAGISEFSVAEDAYAKLGDTTRRAEVLLRRGRLYANKKSTQPKALADFTLGLTLLGEPSVDATRAIAIQLGVQKGQIELAQQKWSEARDTLDVTLARAKAANDYGSLAWGYSALAQARLKLADREGAIKALELGVAAAENAKDDELLANLKANLDKLRR